MLKKICGLLGVLMCLNACTSSSVPVIRTKAKNPIEMGNKTGSQCSLYILGIFGPFGNASIPGAAEIGGITKVTYYDTTTKSYILYSHRCLNVYGY